MLKVFVSGIPVGLRDELSIFASEIKKAVMAVSELKVEPEQITVKFFKCVSESKKVTIFVVSFYDKKEIAMQNVKIGIEQAIGKYFTDSISVECVLGPNVEEILSAD